MMDRYSYRSAYKKEEFMKAHHLKAKALEPQVRHCYILDKDVKILVEYPDYKNPNVKGPPGEIYCENIMACYQNNVKCKYSGISPNYPDPFDPNAPRHKPSIF